MVTPNEKISVHEKDNVHPEWYKQAKDIKNPDELCAFMTRVVNGYHHDYGTICHAIAASALAAGYCANSMEGAQGGITGFQSGAVMWEFICRWGMYQDSVGLRLIDFDKMLFPQYEDKFQKTITKDVWDAIQEKALKSLKDGVGVKRVREHWQSIVDGVVPFGYRVVEK